VSVPIPDDWDNTTYVGYYLLIPDSAQWRAVIKGAIAELDDDYAWHEADDADLDAAIAEINAILDTIGTVWIIDGGYA
jgi:hypothetical protein